MADFVERATLRLVDQTSAPARKINAELARLFASAAKLKGAGGRIDLRLNGAAKAQGQVRQLTKDIAKLQGQRSLPALQVRVDSSQVQRAITRIGTLRNALALPLPAGAVPAVPRAQRPGATGAGGTPRIPAAGVVQAQVNWSPLQTLLHGFVSRIGFTVENAIINGFSKGLKTQDVADTRLALQQLPRDQQTGLNAAIDRLVSEQRRTQTGAVLSRGQIASMLVETLPSVRGDTKAAETLGRLQIQLVQAQLAAGETTAKAVEQAFQFAKAGEQSGRLTDAATGQFSPAAAQSFFGTLLKVAPDIGKEFSGSFVQQAIKYLRVSKFTQNEQGLATALFLNEEMGSTASVGINQAIKQLAGLGTTKKVLAELEKLGLVTTKEVASGTDGRGRQKTARVVDAVADEETLRQDMGGFVVKELLPRMLKEGLDATKPVDAAKFASRITSDRTATDALTSLIIRAAEMQAQVARALERDVSPGRQDELTAASSTIAFEGVRNQFEGLLGEIANSFKGILIPAIQGTSGALSSLASFIRGGGEEGGGLRAGAVATGAVGTGALAFMGGRALLSALNPLTGSATALTGSATALNASAAALMRAAAVQGVRGSVPSIPGAPSGGRVGGGASPAGPSIRTGISQSLLLGGGLVAGLSQLTEAVSDTADWFRRTPEERVQKQEDEFKALGEAHDRLNTAANSFLNSILPKVITDRLNGGAGTGAPKAGEATDMAAAMRAAKDLPPVIDKMNGTADLAQRGFAEIMKKSGAKDSDQEYAQDLSQRISELTAKIADQRAKEKLPGTADAAVSGMEREKTSLQEELTRLTGTTEAFKTTFATGTESLATTNTNFQTTFATGSESLKAVGPVIDASAAQFGPTAGGGILAFAAQFGQVAGQAIAAAASNINVTARVATTPNVGTAVTTD